MQVPFFFCPFWCTGEITSSNQFFRFSTDQKDGSLLENKKFEYKWTFGRYHWEQRNDLEFTKKIYQKDFICIGKLF